MNQYECLDDLEDFAESEDSTEGTITICRDIPGNHSGGPDCFCCPKTFRPDERDAIDEYLSGGQYRMS